MSLISVLIKTSKIEFDVKRRLLNNWTECIFLKPDGVLSNYAETHTAAAGWFVEYSNFLQMPVLKYADETADFYRTLENTSHVALDGKVHKIDKPSVATPDGKKPFFRLPLKATGETYTP